jgi:endonuclease/exonuclease/phosphatase (EEP) superfamily protein YafD
VVVAGLCLGAVLLSLGIAANWHPALDIANNGLPILAVSLLALLGLAFATRTRALAAAAAILLAVNLVLLISALPGAAPEAPKDAERFLRVATFNLWGRNHETGRLVEYVDEIEADVLVLEEVRAHHQGLLDRLTTRYPHRVGDNGLFILSKHPILADGRVERDDEPAWMSRIIRWARLDVNGKAIELAGIHLARPFYPALQHADIMALTRFVQSRTGPLILAGDFNMAPWTWSLKDFTRATGLGRFNTFRPTWPMRWRKLPLLPLVPIDNVFASAHFSAIAVNVGPRLGSDHRPVIADIALLE